MWTSIRSIRIIGLLTLFGSLALAPIDSSSQVHDSLHANKLKVHVNSNGDLGYSEGKSGWEQGIHYPSSSEQYLLFAGALWFGGYDPSDSLHLSSQMFKEQEDLFHGPVADTYGLNYDARYQKLWKVDRDSLAYHDKNWWKSGYQLPASIQDWPAHGDTSNGEPWHLAPFLDRNDNGVYEPNKGDRPRIRGDKAIYFINNDIRGTHDSTDSPLGVEIHGMIYMFDCRSAPALEHSVMVHYDIINRSNTTYDSLMIGYWSDYDVGCANDDYVGSDVERGIAYGYNGDGTDEGCNGSKSYDSLPPAIGQVVLQGPELQPNGMDDAWNGPGKGSVNGVGFDDGTVDNEHWGMQHTHSYHVCSGGPKCDPRSNRDFYNYMTGTWLDCTRVTYGGDGYGYNPPDTLSRFMFPGESDPHYYSSYGDTVPPWDEESTGNQPGDRRILSSTGPAVLAPGDTVSMDMAYVVARDPDSIGSNTAPVRLMKEYVDTIRSYFLDDQLPCGQASFSSVEEEETPSFRAKAYPNPSQGRFRIDLKGNGTRYRYSLYDMRGEQIRDGEWNSSGEQRITLEEVPSGIYFLRIRSASGSQVLKLVKR